MLAKTIAALHAAEAAIKEEYEAVKDWHASARGRLEETYEVVTAQRARLEQVEPPAPETAPPAEAPAAPVEEPAPAPAEEPTETTREPEQIPAEVVTTSG